MAAMATTPHRHDTYSIGRTLAGVQSFHYKGALCHGVPGNTLVLHPDELHDGMAGTDIGFRYRMAYIDPSLIQSVLGGEPLPFIAGGLSSDPRLYRASEALLIEQQWSPRVVAEMNDYQFKVVRIEGEFIWHSHPETDEAFLVLAGTLRIDLPEGSVYVRPGELYVVPRGVAHRTAAQAETKLMMIEPRGVLNTGHEGGARTAVNDVWI